MNSLPANNPELLPEEKTPIIDLAKTPSPKQKQSLEENLINLEKELSLIHI